MNIKEVFRKSANQSYAIVMSQHDDDLERYSPACIAESDGFAQDTDDKYCSDILCSNSEKPTILLEKIIKNITGQI